MKSDINTIFGIDATGDSTHDLSNSKGLKITDSTGISPDATVYSGLRENFVDYHTIDDKNLDDRKAFDLVRITQLNDRLDYLNDREDQIRANMLSEESFMSSDASNIGNLYEWADNRFNRSVGCEAKLKQIEKQIQMSKSGLKVSQRFF
jgi:hypothetical protein